MADTQTNAPIAEYRKQVDAIDEQLLELLGRRFEVCREVAGHKRDNDIPMMQADRVEAVKQRCAEIGERHGLASSFVQRLYGLIIDAACDLEDEIIGSEGGATPQRLAANGVGIDHVAIACVDLETAIATYCETFGFELVERRTTAGAHSGMDSAVVKAGPITFVLVQGTSPESNVSKYIEHYGPGVQHVALEIETPAELLEDLRQRGCDLLTGIIHSPGLDQIFTKRDPNSGIQLEFIGRGGTDSFSDSNVQELFEAMERENVY